MNRTKGWTWAQLKREVDKAHREFFEKRGIDPRKLEDSFFEFGKGVDFRRFTERQIDRISQSSSNRSVQPR